MRKPAFYVQYARPCITFFLVYALIMANLIGCAGMAWKPAPIGMLSGASLDNAEIAKRIFEGNLPSAQGKPYDPEGNPLLAATMEAQAIKVMEEFKNQREITAAGKEKIAQAFAPLVEYIKAHPDRKITLNTYRPRAGKSWPALWIPSGEKKQFHLAAHCLDKELPTPGQNERFQLVPVTQRFPEAFVPTYRRLMVRKDEP